VSSCYSVLVELPKARYRRVIVTATDPGDAEARALLLSVGRRRVVRVVAVELTHAYDGLVHDVPGFA
jgi:hypothetical protein